MEMDKIYCMDCVEYMKGLPNECVDLIIADPPYYKIVKEDWDNQWATEYDYYNWCSQWITEGHRILKEIAANGFNEITIMDVSNVVRNRLEEEGLTVIHRCESAFGQPISYDIIKW